jgi:hypothetical protein
MKRRVRRFKRPEPALTSRKKQPLSLPTLYLSISQNSDVLSDIQFMVPSELKAAI